MKQGKIKKERSIAVKLIQFCLPLVLSGLLQQLYHWVDALIVGNVEGEIGLAGIGATGTLTNFIISLFTGFTVGLGILFAQRFGENKKEALTKTLSTFSVVLGGGGIFLALMGIFAAKPVLVLLNTPTDLLIPAEQYLTIVLLGIPALAVYNVYAAALRGIGDSKAPMLAVVCSTAVNGVLDILLVLVLRTGVIGAAAATVLSQVLMAIFLVCYATKRYPEFRYSIFSHPVHSDALKQGCGMGIPPMIQSGVCALAGVFLQNFMNGFGTHTVAAITTAYRIDTVLLLPVINLGAGISTMVAQKRGAQKWKEIKKVFGNGVGMMIILVLVLSGVIVLTGKSLVAMFGVGKEAVEIGREFFNRLACFYLLFGMNNAMRGYLEGMGDIVYSSVVEILSLGIRLGASYALVSCFGNMVIVYAETIAWGVLFLLYLFRVLQKNKELKKQCGVSAQ